MTRSSAVEAARYTGTYPGRPDQVKRVRHEITRYLAGHPATDDLVLIVSELAANAVLHSASKDDFFTVAVELHETYIHVECEDAGGPWHLQPPDPERPHGLDLVQAFAGGDNWGVDGSETGRVVWARLELGQ